jgi:hypothetical protein
MHSRTLGISPLLLGLLTGVIFGTVNLVFTGFSPLEDDSPAALIRFYGPMFLVWAFAAFRTARLSGRIWSGVTTGMLVALATFWAFEVLILVRVNVFLSDLTDRADWQNVMLRYRASGFESLRLFVNLDYVKGAPLKMGVASTVGAVMGIIGGSVGRGWRGRTAADI